MLTRSYDVVFWGACCLTLMGGILPVFFRRHEWVRGIGVGLILMACLFAVGRVYISGHMAIDQSLKKQHTTGASFNDGAFWTWQAATSALPVFILGIGGLSVLALLPRKLR